jgi:hypothetical protein
MANPTCSYLQHYGHGKHFAFGHYYIVQYDVTASFYPMHLVRSYGCARSYGSVRSYGWARSYTCVLSMSLCDPMSCDPTDAFYPTLLSYPTASSNTMSVKTMTSLGTMARLSVWLRSSYVVLSYVVQYYGAMVWWSDPISGYMVCVVYPASPSTMDLWYVWYSPMSSIQSERHSIQPTLTRTFDATRKMLKLRFRFLAVTILPVRLT